MGADRLLVNRLFYLKENGRGKVGLFQHVQLLDHLHINIPNNLTLKFTHMSVRWSLPSLATFLTYRIREKTIRKKVIPNTTRKSQHSVKHKPNAVGMSTRATKEDSCLAYPVADQGK